MRRHFNWTRGEIVCVALLGSCLWTGCDPNHPSPQVEKLKKEADEAAVKAHEAGEKAKAAGEKVAEELKETATEAKQTIEDSTARARRHGKRHVQSQINRSPSRRNTG